MLKYVQDIIPHVYGSIKDRLPFAMQINSKREENAITRMQNFYLNIHKDYFQKAARFETKTPEQCVYFSKQVTSFEKEAIHSQNPVHALIARALIEEMQNDFVAGKNDIFFKDTFKKCYQHFQEFADSLPMNEKNAEVKIILSKPDRGIQDCFN